MKLFTKIFLTALLVYIGLAGLPVSAAPFTTDLKSQFDAYLNIVAQGPGYNTNVDASAAGPMMNLIAYGLSLLGIIFLVLVVWSGLQWMSAGGNEDKIGEAKKRISRASIGLGITLSAFIISYAVYAFLTEQYLDTAGTEIGAPPGSQEVIACDSVPDCADRGTRIYCLAGNCVECANDNNCSSRAGLANSGIPAGATYCHPTWHVCVLPAGTNCTSIKDSGLCIARNDCKWIVTGDGDHDTWAAGQCFTQAHDCPQCNENTPVCVKIEGEGMECVECVMNKARGACGDFQVCTWNQTCFP